MAETARKDERDETVVRDTSPGLDERVGRLEREVAAMRDMLVRVEPVLARVDERLREGSPLRAWAEPAPRPELMPSAGDLGALKADMGALKAKVDTLPTASDFGALKAEVGALRAKVDSLPTANDFAKVERQLGELTAKIGNLPTASDFAALKAKVDTLPTAVDFGEVKGRISQIPTFWQVFWSNIGLVFAVLGDVFLILRYTTP